jgi:hypothetical protein
MMLIIKLLKIELNQPRSAHPLAKKSLAIRNIRIWVQELMTSLQNNQVLLSKLEEDLKIELIMIFQALANIMEMKV